MLGRYRDILLLVGVVLAVCVYLLFSPVVTREGGIVYYLRAGTSKNAAISELSQQGVIRYAPLLTVYAHIFPGSHLKTGEYHIPKGSSLYDVWRQLSNGTGHYYRAFTVVPGWSFAQLNEKLRATNTLKHATLKMNTNEIMSILGAINVNPEGRFFPETYYYTRDVPDLVILQRAYDLMQTRLNETWATRASGLPYKQPSDLLTAASLVEKEAFLASERPVIAGVLVNRINTNMLLQFDPTVIYGMGDQYHGQIHKLDLKTDTPYNTYVHKGLPPTPIAMPSQSSLDAAAHPENHDYYYFVARGDGSHQFSKTLTDHNAAVQTSRRKAG